MGSILVLRDYHYFATRTLAVKNSLLEQKQEAFAKTLEETHQAEAMLKDKLAKVEEAFV